MKKIIFLTGMIILAVSITFMTGMGQNAPKYTGKWVESFTCGCGPDCMYKLIMFDGSTIDCDDVQYFYSGLKQLEVCTRKGKVVYKSEWIHNYQCFEKEQVGVEYGVKNGGERYGGEKTKGELPEPGIYINGKKFK